MTENGPIYARLTDGTNYGTTATGNDKIKSYQNVVILKNIGIIIYGRFLRKGGFLC